MCVRMYACVAKEKMNVIHIHFAIEKRSYAENSIRKLVWQACMLRYLRANISIDLFQKKF